MGQTVPQELHKHNYEENMRSGIISGRSCVKHEILRSSPRPVWACSTMATCEFVTDTIQSVIYLYYWTELSKVS